MKYWCNDCKCVLDEDELEKYEEPSEYFGRPVYETWWVCPHCGDVPAEYDNQDKACEDCVFFEQEECPYFGYARETTCSSFEEV